MKYRVEFSPQGKKFLRGLGKKDSLRVLNKFEDILESPFRYLKHYEGKGYKIRIGECRAVVDVDFGRRILFVRFMDKRGRVYK